MTGESKIARMRGYMDGFTGRGNKFAEYFNRAAYDTGYQDGAIMLAVRSGDLSGITPFVPSARSNPRLMLADDISAKGDVGRDFLLDSQRRKMKENAYYFLQYCRAVNAPLKIPKYITDAFKMVEDELKDVTGIRDPYAEMAQEISGKEPGEGERKIGKSAALGMGYDPGKEKSGGTVTGRWPARNLDPPMQKFPPIKEKVCTCDGEGFGGPRHTKDCPKYVPGPPL